MDIPEVPTRVPHATPAALAHRNMVQTVTQDHHLPIPAVPLVRGAVPLRVRIPHRLACHHQAAIPDHIPILRHNPLPPISSRIAFRRRWISAAKMNASRPPESRSVLPDPTRPTRLIFAPLLIYTALRAERRPHPAKTARSRSTLPLRPGPKSICRRSHSRRKRPSSSRRLYSRRLLAREIRSHLRRTPLPRAEASRYCHLEYRVPSRGQSRRRMARNI
jgi:hypothetical protein